MPSSSQLMAPRTGLACLFLLAAFSQLAWAAEKDPAKAAKEQVRRLQEQKRGLEMEKNQLQQEKGDIEKKLALAEGELGKKKAMEGSLIDAQRRLRASSDLLEKLKAEVAELKSQVAARDAYLAKVNTQLDSEKNGRGRSEKSLEACAAKNEALYRQGRELLRVFARGGACDAVAGEPLLGLSSVDRENSLEAARDVLDAQRYREAGGS